MGTIMCSAVLAGHLFGSVTCCLCSLSKRLSLKGQRLKSWLTRTLERRWGPHITKCAYYHDPVRSSQKHRKISRGFCVAMYDADRDTALDEPILGTSFSLHLAEFGGG